MWRLIGLVCLAVLAGCAERDEKPQEVVRPVKVFRVGEASAAAAGSFAGEVRARYETRLSFRVAGKVAARRVEIGERVRKGRLLAEVDPADYRLAVEGLKAQLAAARAERDFSGEDMARYRELLDQQLVSPPEFDRHQTAYTVARERVAALEAQLGQATHQLDYTKLFADRDGVVTALEVEAGQVVAAGQPVAKIAQLDQKDVWIDVPEQRLAEIEAGREATVELWAVGRRRFKGRIREIASAAAAASRTYRVKVSLSEGLDAAQLGMTATVHLAPARTAALAIPLAAVFSPHETPEQPRVWLVDEASRTVRSVPVRPGEPLGGERVAVMGLAAGQAIVSAGVQRLREGQAVRLPEDVAQGAAGEGRQP